MLKNENICDDLNLVLFVIILVVTTNNNWILSQITTARKAVTLLLSYLIFTKPLSEQHATGLLLIGMGITLKLLPDYKPKNKASSNVRTSKPPANNGKDNEMAHQIEIEKDEERRPLV